MSAELIGALALFALVTSVTPGPNTLMLMTASANFGLRATVPHMLGVATGFALMLVLVGLGMMRVFEALPGSLAALRIVSVAYLLWLAWKIARAAPLRAGSVGGRPFNFLQAALFQWVNPKAWAIAVSAMSIYAGAHDLAAVGMVAIVFWLVGIPSNALWMVLGRQVRRWLDDERRLHWFNIGMALALVLSVLPVI